MTDYLWTRGTVRFQSDLDGHLVEIKHVPCFGPFAIFPCWYTGLDSANGERELTHQPESLLPDVWTVVQRHARRILGQSRSEDDARLFCERAMSICGADWNAVGLIEPTAELQARIVACWDQLVAEGLLIDVAAETAR